MARQDPLVLLSPPSVQQHSKVLIGNVVGHEASLTGAARMAGRARRATKNPFMMTGGVVDC
jgi:hypothetical protein